MKLADAKVKRSPYRRDVYLAQLIDGARRTPVDEFPIIEKWMVTTKPPKEIVQWDQRKAYKNISETGISFYSEDSTFNAVLTNPDRYINLLKQYACVVGIDCSPYDNMPLVVQKSQIYLNLAISYNYGRKGLQIIPNVRLGDMRTLSSLDAYPRRTLISIGTNGFTKRLDNRQLFSEEFDIIVKTLQPTGIIIYGPAPEWLIKPAKDNNIPIYQYDSYMMRRNRK